MAPRKKSRKNSRANGANGADGLAPGSLGNPLGDVSISVDGKPVDAGQDNGEDVHVDSGPVDVDPGNGVIEIDNPDGTITLSFADMDEAPVRAKGFDENIAETLAESTDGLSILSKIATDLLDGIEQDDRDRAEWIQQRADGLDLLGMKVEHPGANVGASASAVAGQSRVKDALLAEACDRFQANAFAELCPSEGPAKVMSYGDETPVDDELAQALEDDLNFYLTGAAPGTAKEYYPDTRKLLWWTGFASGMFKKVYKCPLRNRPVSESVDGSLLIVSSNATDLQNAERVTQRIDMTHVTLRQMQLQGAYRDIDISNPWYQPNVLQQQEGKVTGLNPNVVRQEDQRYTIYECYCNLDIVGHEYKRDGKITGLPVPYRVVLDKDSKTVLEIRRNWAPPPDKTIIDDEDDDDQEDLFPVADIPFVLFPYATGLGFYGTGLLHRLGNYTMALTAMLRECIDAGQFASFPGFLYAKPAGRQLQNEFRVAPGGGAPIDVSAVGGDINRAVMPLPYKDVSTAMVALMQQTREQAARYGGTAEAPTGEGVANAPVGSVLAAIDQATRIEGGVHKALYAAQREELQKFLTLFKADPASLWRGNPYPAMGLNLAIRKQRFAMALERYYLVPASDPNVPSNMHRQAKASAYLQSALMAPPGTFILQNVFKRWGKMMKIDGIEQDLAPPPPPPGPDPAAQAAQQMAAAKQQEVQVRMIDAQTKRGQVMAKAANDQQNTQLKAQIEASKIAQAQHAALGTSEPDPLAAQELNIKQQSTDQAGKKIVLDAQNAHLERESRLREKAMDIGKELAVHPESQPEVNSELGSLTKSPYLAGATPVEPGASGAGMKDGGEPKTKEDGTVGGSRMDEEEERAAKLAHIMEREALTAEIARVLREYRPAG